MPSRCPVDQSACELMPEHCNSGAGTAAGGLLHGECRPSLLARFSKPILCSVRLIQEIHSASYSHIRWRRADRSNPVTHSSLAEQHLTKSKPSMVKRKPALPPGTRPRWHNGLGTTNC